MDPGDRRQPRSPFRSALTRGGGESPSASRSLGNRGGDAVTDLGGDQDQLGSDVDAEGRRRHWTSCLRRSNRGHRNSGQGRSGQRCSHRQSRFGPDRLPSGRPVQQHLGPSARPESRNQHAPLPRREPIHLHHPGARPRRPVRARSDDGYDG